MSVPRTPAAGFEVKRPADQPGFPEEAAIYPRTEAAFSWRFFFAPNPYETLAIRHRDPRQRVGVHFRPFADDAVDVQKVSRGGVDLIFVQAAGSVERHRAANEI